MHLSSFIISKWKPNNVSSIGKGNQCSAATTELCGFPVTQTPTMDAAPLCVAGLSFDSVAAVEDAINFLCWPRLSLVSVDCVCQSFLISIIAAHGATSGRQQHPSRLTQSLASYLHYCICLVVLLIRQPNLNPNILQQAPVDSRQLLSLTY